jgi:hypothetical protein
MQILKTAPDWFLSPQVTMLSTPQLTGTTHLVWLQTEQQESEKSHGLSVTCGVEGQHD